MLLDKHYKELYCVLFLNFRQNWESFIIRKCFECLANKRDFIKNSVDFELQAILIEFLNLSFPKRMDENHFYSHIKCSRQIKEENFEVALQSKERKVQIQYLADLTKDYDTYQKQIIEIERILKYVKSKWAGFSSKITYEQKLIMVLVLVICYHTGLDQGTCDIDLELRNRVKFVIRNLADQRDLFHIYHLQNLIEKIIEEIYFGEKEKRNLEVANVELIDTLRRQSNITAGVKDTKFIDLRKGKKNEFQDKVEYLVSQNELKRKVIKIFFTIFHHFFFRFLIKIVILGRL